MIITDNTLPPELFKELQLAATDPKMPWYFGSTTFPGVFETPYDGSWSHCAYLDGQITSPIFDIVMKCLPKLVPKSRKLIRVRFGGLTALPIYHVYEKHVDMETPHRTALLYINDSDGDTYFYKDNEIIKTVSPKANRLIDFDGLTFHSSSAPMETRFRIAMNINYET